MLIGRRWTSILLSVLLLTAAIQTKAEDWTYTVRPGDSLWNISSTYLKGISYWPRVQAHNGITDPKQIKPGTRLRIPLAWLKNPPQPVTAQQYVGQVDIVDAAGQTRQLTEGEKLYSGATIRTGDNSSVTLQFADDSRLLIQSNSEVLLDSISAYGAGGMVDTSIRLHRGRVETRVEKRRDNTRFKIITPAAIAAVRGTLFRVSAEPQRPVMRSEVLEGEVDVEGSGSTAKLRAGYGTLAAQGKPPLPPRKLLAAPDLSTAPTELMEDGITLTWPALAGASQYRFQLAASPAFTALVQDTLITQPTIQLERLKIGAYAFRVRAIDDIGLEGIDAVAQFDVVRRAPVVVAQLATPNILSPQITHDVMHLRWQLQPAGTHYRVQVAQDQEFAELIGDIVSDEGNVLLPAPSPGEYFYRVQAFNDQGEVSEFSAPRAIIVHFPTWTIIGVLIPLLFIL